MYEDVEKPPYTILFNPTLTAERMWKAVYVMRLVDAMLRAIQAITEGKERLIAIHGNRLILHLVFEDLGPEAISENGKDADLTNQVPALTKLAFNRLVTEVEKSYASSYPASLFKNVNKCKQIVSAIGQGKSEPSLFPN